MATIMQLSWGLTEKSTVFPLERTDSFRKEGVFFPLILWLSFFAAVSSRPLSCSLPLSWESMVFAKSEHVVFTQLPDHF